MLFIFDMGGVVTSTFPLDALCARLGLTSDDFFAITRMNGDNIWHKLETGKITTADFWSSFNTRVGMLQRTLYDGILKTEDLLTLSPGSDIQEVPQVRHDLFRLYFHPRLDSQTAALISDLRRKHRVVCGTNTIQSHWENHLERGDYALFDQTYASNKIGAAKPGADFFNLILEAENCAPKDAFFTDDKNENCEAAGKIGISAVRFTSAADLRKTWAGYL